MITSLGNVEGSLNTIKANTTSLDSKITVCNTEEVVTLSSGSVTELHSSGINTTLATLNGKIPSKGQNTMDNSTPVVLNFKSNSNI